MKKSKLNKFALLGMIGGLAVVAQTGLEGVQDPSIEIQDLLAAHKCKGKNGCGGLTALRDLPSDSEDENDNYMDNDSTDDQQDSDSTNSIYKPSSPKSTKSR